MKKDNKICQEFNIYDANTSYNKMKYYKITNYAIQEIAELIQNKINNNCSIKTDDKNIIKNAINSITPLITTNTNEDIPNNAFDFMHIYNMFDKNQSTKTTIKTTENETIETVLTILSWNMGGKIEVRLEPGSDLQTEILLKKPTIIVAQETQKHIWSQKDAKKN